MPERKKTAKQAPRAPEPAVAETPPEQVAPAPAVDVHRRALDAFFASESELEAVRSMSLDLYRDELDAKLRSENLREYLSFFLAEEVFGIDIVNIKEIIKPPLITEVPRTDPVIMGILSLRGVIVPVLDLRRRLGLGSVQQTRKSRVLIVEREEGLVGLMVDAVRGVIRLRDDQVEPPPSVFDRTEAEHIRGVGRPEGEMVTLLNVETMTDVRHFIKSARREMRK